MLMKDGMEATSWTYDGFKRKDFGAKRVIFRQEMETTDAISSCVPVILLFV